jgi:hypothetical protein
MESSPTSSEVLEAFRARHPNAPFIELTDQRGFYVREQYPPKGELPGFAGTVRTAR